MKQEKKTKSRETSLAGEPGDAAEQLKHLGAVLGSLERAKGDAQLSGMDDVKAIVDAAYNLCLSNYYLRIRGEYIDGDKILEINT